MADEKVSEQPKQTPVKSNILAETPVFSWVSPEFMRYKRDARWLMRFIVVAIVFIIVLIVIKQWSGVALVIVAATAFIFLSENKPKNVRCAVYPSGILIKEKVHDYSDFKNFWVSYGELPRINFQLVGRFSGQVVLPLGSQDVEQIRAYLAKRLPEEASQGTDITDSINKLFRM